jgi:Rhodopirellula transposase DDE domain
MPSYSKEIKEQMQRLYQSLSEKDRRRYGAIEAAKLGWGGISYISALFGCNDASIRLGLRELGDESAMNSSRIRGEGGGRKTAFETIEGLDATFIKVIAQHTAGSPMDEGQKWTNLKRQDIAELLKAEGKAVSVTVVDQLLKKHNYRQRKAQKRLATGKTDHRNEQFENIEALKRSYQDAGNPVLSMDTKKKN